MTLMSQLSYENFKKMLIDPDVPDSEIGALMVFDREVGGPFDPRPLPNPDMVAMDDPEARFDVGGSENALRWANSISRKRRRVRFERRRDLGVKAPVLVSEGDSWFQFPFVIDDVIDQLNSDHLIWSLDAAGDTAENMVNRRPEYMQALNARAAEGSLAAFLFSAAGNDVIGEDELGVPVLEEMLKPHTPGRDAAFHIDQAALARILMRLETAYRKVITTIRSHPEFAKLPIIFHGYDYAIPGSRLDDPRNPLWADRDQWLGAPMRDRGIDDPQLQRDIPRFLIDALYDMLNKVAGDPAETHVHVVDARGTLQQTGDWADEIHATNAGFVAIANRFRSVLQSAGVA
ncbi:MAG: hypothetical protein AAFY56_02980 [Pseudomonadota bacterium]